MKVGRLCYRRAPEKDITAGGAVFLLYLLFYRFVWAGRFKNEPQAKMRNQGGILRNDY
jgi:hypothetical protein